MRCLAYDPFMIYYVLSGRFVSLYVVSSRAIAVCLTPLSSYRLACLSETRCHY